MHYGLKRPKTWIKTVSKIDSAVKLIHAPLSVLPLKLLAIVMALTITGLLMWEPRQFAEDIGGFSAGLAPLMIWATCSAMVFGMGFVPRRWYFQVFFTPYIALPVLLYILGLRFL
ncbi:cytochrome bd biosynthesis protein [Photobacterium phosphoreum]|nr:cytochrome bd biosynthesis protein [Photobacterium phosphoreum]